MVSLLGPNSFPVPGGREGFSSQLQNRAIHQFLSPTAPEFQDFPCSFLCLQGIDRPERFALDGVAHQPFFILFFNFSDAFQCA
jgi:hypothetical protein